MACLTVTFAQCIEFSPAAKATLTALGYEAANLETFVLDFVNKKGGNDVSEDIQELRDAVAGLSQGNIEIEARMFGLKSGSVDAAKLQNRAVQYSLIGKEFSYDLAQITDSLPSGITYVGSRADIVGDDGKRLSIRGKKNAVDVPSLPATINFSLDLRTKNGNIVLEKSVYVDTDVDKSTLLNVRDLTTAPDKMSLPEAVESLASELALLRNK